MQSLSDIQKTNYQDYSRSIENNRMIKVEIREQPFNIPEQHHPLFGLSDDNTILWLYSRMIGFLAETWVKPIVMDQNYPFQLYRHQETHSSFNNSIFYVTESIKIQRSMQPLAGH